MIPVVGVMGEDVVVHRGRTTRTVVDGGSGRVSFKEVN